MSLYRQVIEIKPDFAGAYNNLGTLLMLQGQYAEALINFINVVSLEPKVFIGHCNIGNVLRLQNRLDDAAIHIRHAIALEPKNAQLHLNFALLLKDLGELESSAAETKKALQLRPDLVDAYLNLGHIRFLQGELSESIELRRKALKLNPKHAEAESALYFSMHYLAEYSPDDLLVAAQNWVAHHTSLERLLPKPGNSPDPQRRLRIGYVSGDFCGHPVACFIEPVLAHHDKSQYEVYCYYNNNKYDAITERLQRYADHWRLVAGASDEKLAQQIRDDAIDILIDLSGHTDRNRLLTFALKPAPVQATWIGAPATTGLPSMDYIIADRFAISPEEERYYAEKVVRLPNAYECFSPPEYPIEPGPLPAFTAGKVTFGCFNNPAKVSKTVIACWSKLLRAIPEAQLIFKYKAYGDTGVHKRFHSLFAEQGIEKERIKLFGYSPRDEFLAAYHEVDIALDPFPYNGGLTTLESLWMGVPVLTLRGDRFVSHSRSILMNIGLGECVAGTEDEYVNKAVNLASDLPRLATLRSELRSQLLNSPLCNGSGFTRDLEAAYRTMWETWCGNTLN